MTDQPTHNNCNNDAIKRRRSPLTARPQAPLSLVVLATLAVGYTLWATQAVILPVLLAVFFALVGNPILRALGHIRIPRAIGALLLLCLGISGTVVLSVELAGPASEWIQQAPDKIRQVARQVRHLTRPMQQANQAVESLARAADGETERQSQTVRTRLYNPYTLLMDTHKLVISVLGVILLTFFFMVFGEKLQRKAIALLPNHHQQRFTASILRNLEHEISRYVLTISVINALVGLIFSVLLLLLSIPLQEALLWGTVVALLNFAPYVGPLIGVLLMLLIGLVQFHESSRALLPALLYLMLHTLEGQLITPIILGHRMAISPLMLIVALLLFGSLWGLIGLLLAVPMLVCIKMVLSRIEDLQRWSRLLE
ncbi:AI-2E family transporter [Xylella fastidiosa]|uniref:AI-2E family transporter n=1 Tax=Xylella fastidiosa subsp. multiplex TaxID=644357 RepID=A0A9Q4MJY8_XYLFS|nr:AI-2E family transporter [Xylella fastidiosa]ERI60611.1 transporter [Xylella fastidiosa subsp. multiplex Griffin-1]ACA11273.1 transport protein [Xylella fastidiosa M12]KAJ4852551.1 AI-2E family transporter [Xylella fastidiosa subsp. multiplex]KFA41752.1 transporter [Xylella fastidiosa]MBE0268767.1 AI-2E family transporter [Xylella fastidiosa subsp. multiplex]